jgi:hypothetical protein
MIGDCEVLHDAVRVSIEGNGDFSIAAGGCRGHR